MLMSRASQLLRRAAAATAAQTRLRLQASRLQPNVRALSSCPFAHGAEVGAAGDTHKGGRPAQWWPENLNLNVLHQTSAGCALPDPNDCDFDYAKQFAELDLNALRADLLHLMTDSQDWWPADYGSYAGLFIRLAWHSAGTYRIHDGRGGAGAGQIRFAPLNSWPDNGNLDKARRLLWPIKKKYGKRVSWADLIIFAGNVALESGGFKPFGFAGGRADVFEPEEDVYWGPETAEDGWLSSRRYKKEGERELDHPLGAVQMGLIYVNPQGPDGNPDPLASARDIRDTFARMAMNDEETVALIAGGHTYGKGHGAANPDKHIGPEPEAAAIEAQGLGWENSLGGGKGGDTITSGLEGAWTRNPAAWDHDYFKLLMGYDWELGKGPGGGHQWYPTDASLADAVPDAHDATKRHKPTMFTTDIALKTDPAYAEISQRFHDHPEQFEEAFAKAWFKLTHRDMGPVARYLGPEVPAQTQLWQDPLPQPSPTDQQLTAADIAALKAEVLASGASIPELVNTAWASASTFRGTDKRGGANGARLALEPQRGWEVNRGTAPVLEKLEKVREGASANVSLADLIVLGGCAAVEEAARLAGHAGVEVPFHPGRTDATQADTDVESFAVLEPTSCGFRNHVAEGQTRSPEELLVDQAHKLTLTAPEMTVLVGGMRALNANGEGSSHGAHGVLTDRPGTLTNDFFVNLLSDGASDWAPVAGDSQQAQVFESGKWTGSRVDLLFGSHSQLRAIAEEYAADDAGALFAQDFAKAFGKVMHLDRFDLK